MTCRPASRRMFANSARVSAVASASTGCASADRAHDAPAATSNATRAPNDPRIRGPVARVLRQRRIRRELLARDVLQLLVRLARLARPLARVVRDRGLLVHHVEPAPLAHEIEARLELAVQLVRALRPHGLAELRLAEPRELGEAGA